MRPMLALAALSAACSLGGEDPTVVDGALTVPWQVGAGGCLASGVEEVVVEVGEASASAPCADGQLTLEVPPGDQVVDLWGLDASGIARYSGQTTATLREGESITVPTVILGALPATLDVTWYFENGRLCGGNGVVDVEIVIFEDDFVVDTLLTPCDDGIERMRDLLAGDYTVSVLGRDAGGAVTFSGSTPVTLDKGDLGLVEVQLSQD